MAKPDWGELQQRFLSAHAKTGISPKDWCEAQGLNYVSARRYVKKPSAQSTQKMRRKDCALRIQINAQKSLSMVMDLLTSNAFSLRNISKIAMPRRLLYALATVKKRRTNWLSVASENFSCAVNCAAAKSLNYAHAWVG